MVRCKSTLALFCQLVALCLLSSAGWAQSMDEKLKSAVDANEIVGLHSTVVALNGKTIAEAYFAG